VQCGLRTLCSHPLESFGCVSSRTLAFLLTDVFVVLSGGCKILSAYETAEVRTLAVAITLLDKGNGESILSVEALAAIANKTVAGSPRLGFVRDAYVHPVLLATAVHKYKSVLENKLCWDITKVQSLDLCTEGKTYGLQVVLPVVNRHSADLEVMVSRPASPRWQRVLWRGGARSKRVSCTTTPLACNSPCPCRLFRPTLRNRCRHLLQQLVQRVGKVAAGQLMQQLQLPLMV
jgi:hypothetical protein